MSHRIEKAMILAAGLGTRLRPITEKCPKPLVPVLNVPNLLHNVFTLKACGIKEIIINLHHLGEQIEALLKNGEHLGVRLHYSYEPTLLGTGGGVKKAEPFFEGKPFILMNCDFISNINLTPFIDQHLKRHALATMLLIDDEKRKQAYSSVGVNKSNHLCSLPKCTTQPPVRTGIFTGIHIIDPKALHVLKEEPCGINEILYPHFMNHSPEQVFGEFVTENYWYDTGSLAFIWATSMALFTELAANPQGMLAQTLNEYGNIVPLRKGIWVKRGTQIPNHVDVTGPVLIGENCTFENEVRIGPNVVLGNGCSVGSGATISRSILFDNTKVVANAPLDRVIQHGAHLLPLSE